MTRRDYVRIAAALAEAAERVQRIEDDRMRQGSRWPTHGPAFGVQIATEALADALAADNPRFDRDRFARAAEGGAA